MEGKPLYSQEKREDIYDYSSLAATNGVATSGETTSAWGGISTDPMLITDFTVKKIPAQRTEEKNNP